VGQDDGEGWVRAGWGGEWKGDGEEKTGVCGTGLQPGVRTAPGLLRGGLWDGE